jgi:zinc protease
MSRTLCILTLAALALAACAPQASHQIETVTLASPDSPLVAIRLLFKVGSIDDPPGKEGLAALTAQMVAEAGTQKRSYSDLVDALYPMAAAIDVDTDREVTVIRGEIHREKLADYTALLEEVLLQPGFAESDFTRNRDQLKSYLTTTLRASNDELLGLEALQDVIFAGHPYGHPPQGSVQSLDALTLDDVRSFYQQHYTQANLMLGVAGGYPEGFVASFAKALAALPAGQASDRALPQPAQVEGRDFTLIDKPTSSVGIHFGFPLSITRADADYYPLMVANSYLGEHRTFHGRLMQQLRGKRGLNYGDYSYIEYWHLPPFTSNPTPNYPRRQQYFSVWVRPVVPDTAHFALRDALYEVDRLIDQGLTPHEFELTRDFLVNYSKLWAQTLSDRLGFLMDSRYYGMDYYIDEIDKRLMALTVEQVNEAVKRHLQTQNLQAVLVTGNAADVQAYLAADEPSPMHYNSPPEADVVEADKAIEALPVKPDSIRIVPVDQMFEKSAIPAGNGS